MQDTRAIYDHLPALFHRSLLDAHGKDWETQEKTHWACLGLRCWRSPWRIHLCSGLQEHRLLTGCCVTGRKTAQVTDLWFEEKMMAAEKWEETFAPLPRSLPYIARKRLATSGRGLRILPPNSMLCWHWTKPPKTNLEGCTAVFFLTDIKEALLLFFSSDKHM